MQTPGAPPVAPDSADSRPARSRAPWVPPVAPDSADSTPARQEIGASRQLRRRDRRSLRSLRDPLAPAQGPRPVTLASMMHLVKPSVSLGLLLVLLSSCDNAGQDRVLGIDARGDVAGTLFLDRNTSRAFDAGDSLLANVRVKLVVAGTRDTTA